MKSNRESIRTTRIINDEGLPEDVEEVGLPGLFNPQDSDLAEEFQTNEAFRDYRREVELDSFFPDDSSFGRD